MDLNKINLLQLIKLFHLYQELILPNLILISHKNSIIHSKILILLIKFKNSVNIHLKMHKILSIIQYNN